MGILSTIGKQIKGLNIVSNLKRAGALAAAIIVIPVEAAATAADARLSNIDRYNGLKNFCSKSAGAISKAAKATVEFTKLGVETMEATAQIVIGQPVVDRLQKVVEAIQKRADKLQGEEKEIIRDPQKFREDRVGRKKIWQQARAAKIMWDSKDSEVEGNSTSSLEPSTDSTETSKTSEAGSSMAQTLEEPSLANNNGTEGAAKVEETLKSTEKTTARGRLARVGQAIKDALTGVQGVASKAGQGVAKGAKSVASGAANAGSKIAEDRKFRTAERHLVEKIVEIKKAKQDLLKKNPEKKEGEKNKSHKADEGIKEKRGERKNLAAALGIKEEDLKEKLKPLKVRADCKLGIKPDPTPTDPKAAGTDKAMS